MAGKRSTTSTKTARAAQKYASGVQALFTPAQAASTDQAVSERSPATLTPAVLKRRASSLLTKSEALNAAAAGQLTAQHEQDRADAELNLLAKAVTDLEVASRLFQAAQEDEDGAQLERAASSDHTPERERAGITLSQEAASALSVLDGSYTTALRATERGTTILRTLEDGREQLTHHVVDTLVLVVDQASATGKNALNNIVSMGFTELISSAGVAALDIAHLFGQGEKLGKLYELCRGFITQAYEALRSLIGDALLDTAINQALDWLQKLNDDKDMLFDKYLEQLYATEDTKSRLTEHIGTASADLDKFATTIDDVDGLSTSFETRMKYAGYVFKAMPFIKMIPLASLPQGRLIIAAICLLTGAYAVFAGADYVDAPKLARLLRTPGVSDIVTANI